MGFHTVILVMPTSEGTGIVQSMRIGVQSIPGAWAWRFAGNAEFAGGFFVGVPSLGPLTKNELRTDIR